MSKIVFEALMSLVTSHVIKVLETIQTSLLYINSNHKINHKNICKNCSELGLKNVDIRDKLMSLQISSEKKLDYDCFHKQKNCSLLSVKKDI